MNSPFKFPRRVRIHGGECGAVARALHHEAQKEALMTHESPILSQADLGKGPDSTLNERKLMSTKTFFKKFALTTVLALVAGSISATSSSATVSADAVTLGAATSTTTVGTAATNTMKITYLADAGTDAVTATAVLTSAPATATGASIPVITQSGAQATADVNADAVGIAGLVVTTGADAAGRVTQSVTLTLTPDAAGTYVVRITPGGGANNTTALTWTVTASVSDFSPGLTTAVYDNAAGVGAASETGAVTTFGRSAGTVAAIEIDLKNVLGASWALTGVSTSATITGSGLIDLVNAASIDAAKTAATPSLRTDAITNDTGLSHVVIASDGTSGVGTVTVSVTYGGVQTLIATKTVTFFGPAATITAVQNRTVAPAAVAGVGGTLGGLASTTAAVTLTVLDAAGNPVEGVTPYQESSSLLVLSETGSCTATTSKGVSYCDIDTSNVSKSGNSASMTFSYDVSATVTISTSAVAFTVGGASSTFKLAFDKASYLAGEAVTVTVTATDSSGNPAADTAVIVAGGLTSNLAATGFPNATAVTTKSGSATVKGFAPATDGNWTVSATDALAATITASATVSTASQAAAEAASDAAAEAIDAANAATDAANLAAEAADAATVAAEEARDAADAATAAVEELATQVATLMAALKAQITTLANTVAKIAKKVKA
jgi:hypothetical protein